MWLVLTMEVIYFSNESNRKKKKKCQSEDPTSVRTRMSSVPRDKGVFCVFFFLFLFTALKSGAADALLKQDIWKRQKKKKIKREEVVNKKKKNLVTD